MATRTNDNLDPFQPISRANERIVDQLDKQKTGADEEERSETHRRYVEQRIRETQMWERRINQKE